MWRATWKVTFREGEREWYMQIPRGAGESLAKTGRLGRERGRVREWTDKQGG